MIINSCKLKEYMYSGRLRKQIRYQSHCNMYTERQVAAAIATEVLGYKSHRLWNGMQL